MAEAKTPTQNTKEEEASTPVEPDGDRKKQGSKSSWRDWLSNPFQPVEKLNKRNIAKVMIKFCGNEGTQNEENDAMLRKLFQGAITLIADEPEKKLCNARLVVFGLDAQSYCIYSGKGKYKYLAMVDEKDEVYVNKR